MLSPRTSRWAWSLAAALIALAVLIWFWPIALTNRVLAGADSLTFFIPYWAYAAESVKGGYLPLWNPYLFSGVPFLANPPAALFYPFFWPFRWLLEPAKAILLAFVFHVWLGGLLVYWFARRSLGLGFAGALLAGLVWAGSGYVGGQAEHISHLGAAAWLPGMWLLLDAASGWRPRGDVADGGQTHTGAMALLAVVIAFTLVTGHTQFAYIGLWATGLYALWPLAVRLWQRRQRPGKKEMLRWPELRRPLILGVATLLGFLLAAAQVLPTWELARLSARGGGLSYRDIVAFSLPIRTMLFTFLPAYGQALEAVFGTPAFPEFVAYLGVTPIVLVGVSLLCVHPRARIGFPLFIGLTGLALAFGGYNPLYYVLYKLVPGFDLFRAPARWLSLYVLAAALLAGSGLESLHKAWRRPLCGHGWMLLVAGPVVLSVALLWLLRRPGWEAWLGWGMVALASLLMIRWTPREVCLPALILLAVVELYAGARTLPHAHPTAPEAATALRTAPAAILADGANNGRVLSLSDLTFDPGDMAQHRQLYGGQLTSRELYDFHIATKMKEVLAPNLPLVYRIPSLDGYDGGLLPLPEYVMLQRLLWSDGETSPDGRLWQRLHDIPPQRVLDLFHVGYVITDKLRDLWQDGVYYDLQQQAVLSAVGKAEATGRPVAPLAATRLGIVSYVRGGAALPDGTLVGEVVLTDARGRMERLPVRLGVDTAEGRHTEAAAHTKARIARHWPDIGDGWDYITVLAIPNGAMAPDSVTVQLLAKELTWVVRGVSLIDDLSGGHRPVLVSTEQTLRRIHSGDVKVYRVEDVWPRAYVVHTARVIEDETLALTALMHPDFNPRQTVILSDGKPLASSSVGAAAQIVSDEPERVVVEAVLAEPGYLVLSDTYYPGWRATVDGQPATIVRANLLYRAVALDAGRHRVEFRFVPTAFYRGVVISAVALVGIALLLMWHIK